MAIDQGTTGTTVSIIHADGTSVAKVNEEYEQIYPQPGWVEHNPEHIWRTVVSCLRKTLELGRVNPHDIAAIGITNQRETSVIWERETNKPIYNAIVWQCRRTTDYCNALKKKKGLEKLIKAKTGLVVDPYFSASKFNWILNHVSGAKKRAEKGELAAGTIDTFVLWRLTNAKVHKTDVSNASRTQLMNLEKPIWDKDLLKIFQIPAQILPQICPSSGIFGKTENVPGLPDGIPISGIAGDQQSALFGQTCFNAGDAKCTFGTGSFMLMNTGSKIVSSSSGILTTVAWQLKDERKLTYALEGGAFICGAAVQWLRDELKIIGSSGEIENLAKQVKSSEGVDLVPAMVGLGAPYWDSSARGAILGITRGTNRAHIARATLDAMALQNVDILESMQKDLGKKLKNLRVDGGASANNMLMQLQSDYLGSAIARPRMIETTSAGAAYLAGLGVGFWGGLDDIRKVWKPEREFKPEIKPKERSERLHRWHRAIRQVMAK